MARPRRVATEPAHLSLIVRAFAGRRGYYDSPDPDEQWPSRVLILDTETTTDPTQRLLFGSYQYARWQSGGLVTENEGLFYPDDLPRGDPTGFEALRTYALEHELALFSRRAFMRQVFWRAAYGAAAMVVGFNLPFDLSRLAISHGSAKKRNRGGFSFVLGDYWDEDEKAWKENHFRPRLIIKHRNSKSAFIEFGLRQGVPKEEQRRGRFLDLRTCTYAPTSESYTLRSAGEAFGVEQRKATPARHGVIDPSYIDYNRQDVTATKSLLEEVRKEYERYPITLDPCKALSPASIAKACLRAMGIGPPMHRFKNVPDEINGWAMAAYYGGRAEARIRRTVVPIVTTDFLSMYPTVNALMDLWRHVTASTLEVVDVTEKVRALLEPVDLEQCFDPKSWKDFAFLAEIEPQEDILPVRSRYDGKNRNIGVNYLNSDHPIWYAGPDLVASTLQTGRPPKVLRAVALRASGTADGLRPIELGLGVVIDPTKEDFFRCVIELRKSLDQLGLGAEEETRLDRALKIFANSGSYGVFAEMQRRQRHTNEAFPVHGLTAFDSRSNKKERPGEFAFPFFAAITTAGARLMLAMLERSITDLGGVYAFCDTDSMAIVANHQGGTIDVAGEIVVALAWVQVESIRDRFSKLNPYDPAIVGESILKIEKENFENEVQRQLLAFVISAKRYVLLA